MSNFATYKCELCERTLQNKFTRFAMDYWDWFTGYLPETVHFCPQHKDSARRHELFSLSRMQASEHLGYESLGKRHV